MSHVVQIVPRFPPPLEGVGTYALALASALRSRFDTESGFLVADPTWERGEEGATFPALRITPRRSEAIEEKLAAAADSTATTIVHYANYGYAPRGCPGWLVEGLARWKRRSPHGRLIVIFHEVHASGPPWRSSFWLSPVQRRLARRLAGLAEAAVTSLERYARRIAGELGDRPIEVLPVFSTVGEPEQVPSLEARPPRMVVFGGRGTRERAYRELGHQLATACRETGATEIHDIGPPSAHTPSAVSGIPVHIRGALPADQVSAILLASRAGFLAYPTPFLPKSTVFAAYCAHGVVPICAWAHPNAGGELQAGRQFWAPGGTTTADRSVELQAISTRARHWYRGHSLDRQLLVYHRLLSG